MGCFEICHLLGLCGRCCWCPQHHSWDRASTVATIVEQTEAREPGTSQTPTPWCLRASTGNVPIHWGLPPDRWPYRKAAGCLLVSRTPKIIHAAIDPALILRFNDLPTASNTPMSISQSLERESPNKKTSPSNFKLHLLVRFWSPSLWSERRIACGWRSWNCLSLQPGFGTFCFTMWEGC